MTDDPSDLCHICGPVKHEAPTVLCAPCALSPAEDGIPCERDPAPFGLRPDFACQPDPAGGKTGDVRGAAHITEAQLSAGCSDCGGLPAPDGPRKADSAPHACNPYGSGIMRIAALWWRMKQCIAREWAIFHDGELP